jgi:hypothetical protein
MVQFNFKNKRSDHKNATHTWQRASFPMVISGSNSNYSCIIIVTKQMRALLSIESYGSISKTKDPTRNMPHILGSAHLSLW